MQFFLQVTILRDNSTINTTLLYIQVTILQPRTTTSQQQVNTQRGWT